MMVDKQEIVNRVKEHVEKIRLGSNITLKILEKGIRQENDWWYIPIQPSTEPPKTTEYYEELANIETELMEDENIDILFVPTAPDEVTTS